MFNNLISQGFPRIAIEPTRFIATNRYPDRASEEVADLAETARQDIVDSYQEYIDILYSPSPDQVQDQDRPKPGARLLFSPERVANTGKNRKWGSFLHLCVRESRAQTVLELGTCAGVSAFYMASADRVERLVTVEGSSALAKISEKTLDRFGDKVEVINALFDDALDRVLPELPRISFLYIDGHHEKVATIHYFERIRPNLVSGAWVVFDDISWSQDMRDGWNEIVKKPGFAHFLDYGAMGIGLWDGSSEKAKLWDLRAVTGVQSIGKPHGWKHKEGSVID